MMTNFNVVNTRQQTNSIKWDNAPSIFGKAVLPMWIADMDFQPPEGVTAALQKAVNHNIYGYNFVPSDTNAIICNWLEQKYHWSISPEMIIFNHNVVASISVAIEALTQRAENVLMCPPVYNPFFEVPPRLGRNVVFAPLRYQNNRYYFDFDTFEQCLADPLTTAFLLCSPHNPSGRVWTQAELARIITLCAQYNVAIISDEIHSDLAFEAHVPIASLNTTPATIVTLMAPSKTFNLAGLQAAYLICDNPELRERIIAIRVNRAYPDLNIFGATALKAAYETGESWLAELRVQLQKNITAAHTQLNQLPLIEVTPIAASYLLWIDYRQTGISEDVLMAELIEQGVGITLGSVYGEQGRGFIRINIATTETLVTDGITRIVAAFTNLMS